MSNTKSTPKVKTDNEHYVPRTYLQAFAFKKSQVYVFDKKSNKSFSANKDNILSERYLYDFSEEMIKQYKWDAPIDKQIVEKLLGQTVDSFWKNIAINIENNFEWFSIKYSYHFLDVYRIVATQMLRTPQGKKNLANIYSEIYNKTHPELDNALLFIELMKILKMEPDSDVLDLLLNNFGHICIGTNDSCIPLITSDTPIVMISEYPQAGEKSIFFPVKPNRCIFLQKRKFIKSQLNETMEDFLNGNLKIDNFWEINTEAYNREKNLNEKLNALTKTLTSNDVIKLNLAMTKNATRFLVSNHHFNEQGLLEEMGMYEKILNKL